MKNTSLFLHVPVMLAGVLAMAPTVDAVALYTQNFDNISGSGKVLATQAPGWNAYISKKAFDMGLANRIQYDYNNDVTPTAAGVLQAYVNSISTTSTPGVQGGYLIHSTANASGAAGSPIIISVGTGLNIALADYSSLSFSWNANTNNVNSGGVTSRLLLQVDNVWYASTTAQTIAYGTAAQLDTMTLGLSFTPESSAWNQVTLTPGTATNTYEPGNGELSISGTTLSGNLTGTITGVGLLSTFGTNAAPIAVRIDQLNISGVAAIPEPADLALLVGLAGMVTFVARRRR